MPAKKDMAALWQWRDDYGWKDYAPSDSAKIEAAHQARDARPVTLGNARYVVLVTNLEQVNQRTGFARDVRRVGAVVPAAVSAAARAASSGAAWEFREGGRWVPFSPADSAALEAAKGRGDAGASFTFRGTRYDVDFASMSQENTRTRFRRDVRRVGGAAAPEPPPPPAAPPAPAGPPPPRMRDATAAELAAAPACPICGDDFADDASSRRRPAAATSFERCRPGKRS